MYLNGPVKSTAEIKYSMFHYMSCQSYSNKHSKKLTKRPAQKGQDCLTRGDEVKARLVKLKASTMAPSARWHKPRYSSTRALVRPDIPLRLPDRARDPDIEATLLESDGEGMMATEKLLKLWDYVTQFNMWKYFFKYAGRVYITLSTQLLKRNETHMLCQHLF